MYLLTDFSGPYSEIEYGKKGDQVTVIKQDEIMALVSNGKDLFHIRLEKLSYEKPVTDNPESIMTVPANPIPVKRKTKSSRPAKQNNLF